MAKKKWTDEERAAASAAAKARYAALLGKAEEAPEPEAPAEEATAWEAAAPDIAYAPGGELVEPEPEVEAEPEPQDGFGRFLLSLDDETRELLDEAELRVIYEAQQEKALEARRAERRKAATTAALHHAKIENNLMPEEARAHAAWQKRMNEKVQITIDLPEFGDIGLRVDGKIYQHNRRYTVTRAVFESLREMMARAQEAEMQFDGKSKQYRQRMLARGSQDWHINMEGRA